VPDGRGSDDSLSCPQGGANRAPLAPAKVLRADAYIPTRRRSSRAQRAGASTAARVREASRGVAEAEASGSRLATPTVEPQRSAVETRQEPAVAEAQPVAEVQPAAPIVVALPASSATEARQVPVAAEALPGAEVAAPQQESSLAGSSQATVVEIPDDDAPPPGWDQWGSLPAPAPEPQAGALVRRWDGHMVAGGSRHGIEASSSRAAP
jgi:hypothetical protein